MKKFSLFILLVVFSRQTTAQSFGSGFNFYLPPQDTSSGLFLPQFPAINIGNLDYVTADANGHFSVQGKPIRFFGTNFVAAGAFPTKTKAWYIAGRLRKMGFNLVRFHHLDNPWDNQSLFEAGKDTRHLNPVTLDRLENMIAEMKKNGIFINMNLHVSRTFNAFDGIPVYDSLPEFSKIVNYFDPVHIALHKEYAKQLLTHVNPYTGKSLPNDPVMAMMEITNENSLYRSWRDGALRMKSVGGQLSYHHTVILDSLWNVFVAAKYLSTSALSAAWNNGMVDRSSSDQIREGGFENAAVSANWTMEKNGSAVQASMVNDVTNPYKENFSAKVTVSQTDGTDWHLQFKQTGLTIRKDSVYVITFAARSDSIRSIPVFTSKETSPYTWYGGITVQLTPQWKQFSFTIRASETMLSDVRLSFVIGGHTGTYWFDDISLKQPSTQGLLPGESVELRNIKRIEFSDCNAFSQQRVKDISAFYFTVETDYFTMMRSYLKDSLGVRVPIVGTNWNVGVADLSVQSTLDYVDNHSYWDHPSFPTIPWSSTDWLINNTPMVTSTSGGTIPDLMAGVGMVNKPYTISEYNHAFPNRFQTEGVLFLSSYASFHDVDGLMFFDYNGSSDDWESDKQNGYFNISRNSAMMSLMPSCAFAYRNGLISRYKQLFSLRYTADTLKSLPLIDGGNWQGLTFFAKTLALQHGIRTESYTAEQTTNFSALPAPPVNPFTSDTKELVWNTNGLFTSVSPKFIGITGLLDQFPNVSAGALTVASADGFGTLTWLSLTDDSLGRSRRSLITLSSRLQNTNMLWDGTRTLHDKWGQMPTQMQPLKVQCSLHIQADSLRVYALDATGNPTATQIIRPSSPNTFPVLLDQLSSLTLWYGIEAYGAGTVSVGKESPQHPGTFALFQNYPNPFNPSTVIEYELMEQCHVSLDLFDALGRKVASLINNEQGAGSHRYYFSTGEFPLSSGLYFYHMRAGTLTAQRKMIILK